jgi:hypothetical protein
MSTIEVKTFERLNSPLRACASRQKFGGNPRRRHWLRTLSSTVDNLLVMHSLLVVNSVPAAVIFDFVEGSSDGVEQTRDVR